MAKRILVVEDEALFAMQPCRTYSRDLPPRTGPGTGAAATAVPGPPSRAGRLPRGSLQGPSCRRGRQFARNGWTNGRCAGSAARADRLRAARHALCPAAACGRGGVGGGGACGQ